MRCKVCSSESEYFASSKVLEKYPIKYFRCPNCDFVQTEEPFWLEETYSEQPIAKTDTGVLSRNIGLAHIAKVVIDALFRDNEIFLDYGGGLGIFVRLMRDIGCEFYLYEPYCDNLFAQGFAVQRNELSRYGMVTAIEVFEHLPDPLQEIDIMANCSKNIFFTTELMPADFPKPDAWWYYGLDHGQHISFYTAKTLSLIGEKFGLNYYTNGTSLHLFSNKSYLPPELLPVLGQQPWSSTLLQDATW